MELSVVRINNHELALLVGPDWQSVILKSDINFAIFKLSISSVLALVLIIWRHLDYFRLIELK